MAHGGYKREVRGRGLESRGVAQAERWDSRTQLDYGPPLGEMSAYVRHRSARCCDPVRIQARQELLLACDVRAAQGGAVLEHPILWLLHDCRRSRMATKADAGYVSESVMGIRCRGERVSGSRVISRLCKASSASELSLSFLGPRPDARRRGNGSSRPCRLMSMLPTLTSLLTGQYV